MYRLLACDLDETLLNDQKTICKRNREAIEKAVADGLQFVVATGRGFGSIQSVYDELPFLKNRSGYAICANGALIVDCLSGISVYKKTLEPETALRLIQFGFDHGLCVQVFTEKDVYAFNLNEDEKNWLLMFKPDAIICHDHCLEKIDLRDMIKVMYQSADLKMLHDLTYEQDPAVLETVEIAFSSGRYQEFTAKGVSKGSALDHLAWLLSVDQAQTIGIGDHVNDLTLIEKAGLGCAVSNGVEVLKRQADYVCQSDHNTGGVAEVIERFVLTEGVKECQNE